MTSVARPGARADRGARVGGRGQREHADRRPRRRRRGARRRPSWRRSSAPRSRGCAPARARPSTSVAAAGGREGVDRDAGRVGPCDPEQRHAPVGVRGAEHVAPPGGAEAEVREMERDRDEDELRIDAREAVEGCAERRQALRPRRSGRSSGRSRPGRSLISPSTPHATSSRARSRLFTGQVMIMSASSRSSCTRPRVQQPLVDRDAIESRAGRLPAQPHELARAAHGVDAAHAVDAAEGLEQRPAPRADRDGGTGFEPRAQGVEHALARAGGRGPSGRARALSAARRRRAAQRAAVVGRTGSRASSDPTAPEPVRASSGGAPRGAPEEVHVCLDHAHAARLRRPQGEERVAGAVCDDERATRHRRRCFAPAGHLHRGYALAGASTRRTPRARSTVPTTTSMTKWFAVATAARAIAGGMSDCEGADGRARRRLEQDDRDEQVPADVQARKRRVLVRERRRLQRAVAVRVLRDRVHETDRQRAAEARPAAGRRTRSRRGPKRSWRRAGGGIAPAGRRRGRLRS